MADTTKPPTIASGIPFVAINVNIKVLAADALFPKASAYLAPYNIYIIPRTPIVLTKDPITPVIHPDTQSIFSKFNS